MIKEELLKFNEIPKSDYTLPSISTSRPRLSISPSDSSHNLAYQKLLNELNRSIHEQELKEINFKKYLQDEVEKDKLKQAERLKRKKQHAAFLQRQIEEKEAKQKCLKLEFLKPGISENFHGYPNIPETPKKEKRKRELSLQKYFKKDLDEQMEFQAKNHEYQKQENLKLENKIISDANNELDNQKIRMLETKKFHKEMLTESWNKSIQSKELAKKLEKIRIKGIKLPRVFEREETNFEKNNEKMMDELKDSSIDEKISSRRFMYRSTSMPEITPISKFIETSRQNLIEETENIEKYHDKIKRVINQTKHIRNYSNPSLKPTLIKNNGNIMRAVRKSHN
ncbi:unnamed protein product [Blepharisma stoltei]|uniref:Uncharacterized protein n=1 Tax=Blepharisma stoltei TaxID=1481888 RepID=A0AAU9IZQ8_9CILI|nr:unnamed protein product [Blepharisma stoltei]